MRLTETARDITRIGLSDQGSFGIKATGKAFRILSSSLYRDKIMAIVRELCCNALDSHVAAGCPDRPIYVGLPNNMSPYFLVRDYGTGMTHREMMGLYTTYFDSTKVRRDDQIGALGLGSKAPFSYTDSFTVTVWSGRERRDYCAFIAEDGTPSIALLGKDSDRSERGVQVSVPVPRVEDHAAFSLRASVILGRFTPEPVVEGNPSFAFARRTVMMKGKHWEMCAPHPAFEQLGLGNTATALMGPVGYPITSVPLQDITAQRIADLRGLEVQFPMGAVDIMAGREDLSYDRRTIETVTKVLLDINAEFHHVAQSALDTCATAYEAKRKYAELRTLPFSLHDLTFRQQPLFSDTFEYAFKADFSGLSVAYLDAKAGKGVVRTTAHGGMHTGTMVIPTNAVVLCNDLKRGGKSRALQAQARSSATHILIDGPEAEQARFLEQFEGLPTTRTSRLPAVAASAPRGVGGFCTVYRLHDYPSAKVRKSDWVARTVNTREPPPENALLLPIERFAPLMNGNRAAYAGHLLRAIRNLGIWRGTDVVWGLSVTNYDKLRGLGGRDFWKTCRQRVAFRLVTDEVLMRRIRQYDNGRATRIASLTSADQTKLNMLCRLLPRYHALQACVTSDHAVDADAASWMSVISHFKLDIKSRATSSHQAERWTAISAQYPLLKTLIGHHTALDEIVAYLAMVDEHNARHDIEAA